MGLGSMTAVAVFSLSWEEAGVYSCAVNMRNLLLWIALLTAPLGRMAAQQPGGAASDGADPMKEALKTGATAAQLLLSDLKRYATTEFPGTLGWVHGAGATVAALDKENPTDAWRSLDPDRLITRNAAWWQAYYEVAPADPGLAVLHGATLLCAGDAQRAIHVLRIALNHGEMDAGSARVIVSIMEHAHAFMEPSHAMVRQGVAMHDKGDYLGAIAKYDAALKIWPRNSWALYEKGFSIREHERKEEPVLVVNLFARSRAADPFQFHAWQGTVKDIPGMKQMMLDAQPIWEKSQKDLNYRMTEEELTKLADTLQVAEVDDLALVTRQMLVQHRGRYAPEDHRFIARSLRRLAPGDRTEATLAKLASASFKAYRLYEPLGKDEKEKP
jgi:tetratricopeptide (TPR) repeat protein